MINYKRVLAALFLVGFSLVLLAGASLWYNSRQVNPGNVDPVYRGWESYSNTQYGFGFNYPDTFRLLPDSDNDPLTLVQIARVVDLQHCNMVPECVPTTNNPLISVSVHTSSYDSLERQYNNASFQAQPIIAGGRPGFSYELGAEGEGYVIYAFPLGNQTLLVSQGYINEQVVGAYQNKPEFWNLAIQKERTREILSTLRFTK